MEASIIAMAATNIVATSTVIITNAMASNHRHHHLLFMEHTTDLDEECTSSESQVEVSSIHLV